MARGPRKEVVVPKARGARRVAPNGKKPADDLFDDEVDDFHAERDKLRDRIALDGDDDDDESGDEPESDERLGDTYGLDAGDDDDDEDDEDDDDAEDDDDSEEEIRVPGARLNLDDGDEPDDDNDGAARGARGWGKKGAYYGADDIDAEDSEDVDDDEQAAKLEEEEARRLQAEQLGLLTDDDFANGTSLGDRAARGKAAAAKQAPRARAGSALAALDAAFDTMPLRGEAVGTLERRARTSEGEPLAGAGAKRADGADGAVGEEGLSSRERLEVVSRDAPELLMLLADLKSKLDETRSRVAPLVAAAGAGELRVGGGLGYLQTKLQLLLSYCTNVAFFLALKASGAAVRDHPVIAQLVRLRAVFEKLGPLDKKLRFQVDRLLQLASADGGADGARGATGSARPNPRALIAKGAEGLADDDDDDEGDGDGAPRRKGAATDGIYRPPKLAAVEYDGDAPTELGKKVKKSERDAARRLERASRSALVRELRNEFGDEPEELAAVDLATGPRATGAASERLARDEEERRRYEEEHFVRLQLTKKQKRQQRQLHAAGALDSLDRLDDLTPLLRDGAAAAHAAGIDVDAIIGAGSGRTGKAGKGAKAAGSMAAYDDDDDGFLADDLVGLALPAGGLDGNGHDDGVEAGLDDYEEAARSAKDRKRARAADRQAATLDAVRASAPDDEMDGDKRSVGRDIAKNKGLTRQRKKLDRNVRTKNRDKFRRAVIKRKGQVRDVQQRPSEYGGEATGIKRNVSHSRRFA